MTDLLMKLERFSVKPVLVCDSTQPDLGRQIDQEREIGLQAVCCNSIELSKEPHIHASGVSLVHNGGIGMAVAEHNLAFRKRRSDNRLDVVASIGQEKERFCGAEKLFTVKKNVTDLFADLTRARLSGFEHFVTGIFQPFRHGTKRCRFP